MLKLEECNSMRSLLKLQRELETTCSDSDLLEEVAEKTYDELEKVTTLIRDIQKTKMPNKYWLELILSMLNNRRGSNYTLKIIKEEGNREKIFTFDGISKVEVEDITKSNGWSAIIFATDQEIIQSLPSVLFLCPNLFREYYKKGNLVLYGASEGQITIPEFLSEETDIGHLIDYGQYMGFKPEEIAALNEHAFLLYKNKQNNKTPKIKKRVK